MVGSRAARASRGKEGPLGVHAAAAGPNTTSKTHCCAGAPEAGASVALCTAPALQLRRPVIVSARSPASDTISKSEQKVAPAERERTKRQSAGAGASVSARVFGSTASQASWPSAHSRSYVRSVPTPSGPVEMSHSERRRILNCGFRRVVSGGWLVGWLVGWLIG